MQSKSKYILIFVVIVVVALIFRYLENVVVYLIVSVILSLIGQPLVKLFSKIRIKKFHLSPALCALLTLVTMMVMVGILFSLFVPLLVNEITIISKINPNEIMIAFKEPLKNLESTLQKYQINSGANTDASIPQMLTSKLSSVFGFAEISSFAQRMIGFTGSILAAFFSISFITFFLMKDEKIIYNVIIMLTPPKYIDSMKIILRNTKFILSRYFIGVLLDMAFVATLVAIGLSIVGVENALLIGLFAGIINVIPYLGPLLGAGFAIIIGVSGNLQLDFYTQIMPLVGKIATVILIVQLLDALFFQPLVMANIVKAHPLEIFLVILSAGTIGGITGMILAIPVYTIIRIVANQFLNKFQFVQRLTSDLEKFTEKHNHID